MPEATNTPTIPRTIGLILDECASATMKLNSATRIVDHLNISRSPVETNDLVAVVFTLEHVQEELERLHAEAARLYEVRPAWIPDQPVTAEPRARDGYILVGGLHRLEAMVQRGATHIPAVVVAMDDLVATIAECDENLCGSNLSQSERALFTRRRKEAYEALHPETKATNNGGGGRNNETRRQVGDDIADRFTADAATKTGQSERTVQRDAERGENIPAPILAEIAGTDLDKGVVLDRLKNADDAAAELDTIRARWPASCPTATSTRTCW